EILEDEDRKQELYVCKFVVVNGVSENNAQEKITHLSNDGQNLLKNIEKLRLKPYNDQNGKEITSYVKGATIGYGHLIGQNEWDLYKNGILYKKRINCLKAICYPLKML
ncbi:hypothetical protein ACI2FZ_10100, partial [Campylobacter jejuni]